MESNQGCDERIQLCLSSLNYPPFFGGAALRFSRYLPGLAARGVDGRVFTCLPLSHEGDPSLTEGYAASEAGRLLPSECIDGTPVHRVVLKSPRMRG